MAWYEYFGSKAGVKIDFETGSVDVSLYKHIIWGRVGGYTCLGGYNVYVNGVVWFTCAAGASCCYFCGEGMGGEDTLASFGFESGTYYTTYFELTISGVTYTSPVVTFTTAGEPEEPPPEEPPPKGDGIVVSSWPQSKGVAWGYTGNIDYHGEVWGHNPDTDKFEWLEPETFPEYFANVLAFGGGRYKQHHVAVTSKGEVYYA